MHFSQPAECRMKIQMVLLDLELQLVASVHTLQSWEQHVAKEPLNFYLFMYFLTVVQVSVSISSFRAIKTRCRSIDRAVIYFSV